MQFVSLREGGFLTVEIEGVHYKSMVVAIANSTDTDVVDMRSNPGNDIEHFRMVSIKRRIVVEFLSVEPPE
jgi:hypothetical protein